MRRGWITSALTMALLNLGCVVRESSQHPLVPRAAFDLNCQQSQLQWNKLNDNATVYGVSGCGRRATYVYNAASGQWIMNASSETAGPATQSGPPGAGTQQGVNP